jgi:hypothetical protein
MMMDTVRSSMGEEGLQIVQSEVCDPIEEVYVFSRADMVPCIEVISELNQQLSQVNSCLEPVLEHELLQHVDSLVHLGSDQLEEEDFPGTISACGNHSGSDAGEYVSCILSSFFVSYAFIRHVGMCCVHYLV